MAFKFSEDGPAFPGELLDQLLAGEVVFLCGAGVSSPQLPGFVGLVENIFASVDLPMEEGEREAFNAGRLEEVLGSLARRVVHQSKMYDEVARLLRIPVDADLSHHHTLLRLSRNMDNRLCLITTNFDTLFERAVAEAQTAAKAVEASVTGQSISAPGAEDFGGIIHLHGRLADSILPVPASPLVLTSAEYGDAYMRSGWASRFLFDLARCKTIVLVGYKVGDAPVRYFLNVLEADRGRFTDLRSVYVLEGVEAADHDAAARWATVAVQPITYPVKAEGLQDHGVLWRDLERLADLVERPRPGRRAFVEAILSKPLADATELEKDQLDWLMRGRGDLWDIIIQRISDPAWFHHFIKNELWLDDAPNWVIPKWCARRRTESLALNTAIEWYGRGRREMLLNDDQNLHFEERPPSPWYERWNLLIAANIYRLNLRHGDRSTDQARYRLASQLNVDAPIDLDLQRAVDLLTPALTLREPHRYSGYEGDNDQSLRSAFSLELRAEGGGKTELLTALFNRPVHARRLVSLATGAILSTLHLVEDAGLTDGRYDYVEQLLPSVALNRQNEHHGGVVHLVTLLTHFFDVIAADDPAFARRVADQWTDLPSLLGQRLWLHAMGNSAVFAIDDVMANVRSLSEVMFWERRPELFNLIQARFAEATADQIEPIVDRIAAEGPTRFADLELRVGGQTDWLPYARDHAMWTRLYAIEEVGTLTDRGVELVEQIAERQEHLRRPLEESDFFSAYSTGVHMVTGDPTPLINAQPEERLEIAHSFVQSFDLDNQANWRAFCGADPSGAFQALIAQGFRVEDLTLWTDLLNAIFFPVPEGEDKQRARSQLIGRIFRALDAVANADLTGLIHGLASLLGVRDAFSARTFSHWWDRLWAVAIVAEGEDANPESTSAFYDRVINHASGKLAESLLKRIQDQRASGHVSQANLKRLRRICAEPSFAGHLARGVFAQAAGFLVYVDEGFVSRHLLPVLLEETDRAKTLRNVMAEWSSFHAHATRILKAPLIQAALELPSDGGHPQQFAAKLLNPVVVPLIGGNAQDWGISSGEVRSILTAGSAELRAAVVRLLLQWQSHGYDLGSEQAWIQVTCPAFESVWPLERRFKNTQITSNLLDLASRTGTEFPNALEALKSYLAPFEGNRGSLFFLFNSDLPQRFPEAVLDMLWLALGRRNSDYGSPELGTALDTIKCERPGLEVDRRFQWLETQAMRFA